MSEINDQAFSELIQKAREEIKDTPHFQLEEWNWIHELEEEGFFIFCYLLEDFNKKILSMKELEDTVYTLSILRHKFVPPDVLNAQKISTRWQLQLIFNLYERLKNEEMDWEACQIFIDEQIKSLPIRQNN